jgi:hypothetical protein
VREGFYSTRTDFLRTAIRNQLRTLAGPVKQAIARKTLTLGLQHYSREDLEAVRKSGRKLRVRVLGTATIAQDVSPKLALATIEEISVLGAFHASNAVKRALSSRINPRGQAQDIAPMQITK